MAHTATRVVQRARRFLARNAGHVHAILSSIPARLTHRNPPIPPPWLLHEIGGTCDAAWFLAAGEIAAHVVTSALQRRGHDLARCHDVLDFGCGVGRVIRHWAGVSGPRFFGTDFNPRLIAWCRRHLPFARFDVNALKPPLPYDNASFDLIYAFSVFTHMDQALQLEWMNELGRVLRPGGLLIISLHGEYYLPQLNPEQRARFRDGNAVVFGTEREGSNHCAAFHPEPYVRIVLARDWEMCEHVREGARGNPNQDLYVLRKPDRAAVAA